MNTTKLILTFGSADGDTKITYSNIDSEEATSSNVTSLMNVIIANNTIFKTPPLTAKAAVVQVTTSTDITINS